MTCASAAGKKRSFELHRENTALYFILLSRDTTASVGARSARRQQPHLVHHAHLLDQDPLRVQAVRSLLSWRQEYKNRSSRKIDSLLANRIARGLSDKIRGFSEDSGIGLVFDRFSPKNRSS